MTISRSNFITIIGGVIIIAFCSSFFGGIEWGIHVTRNDAVDKGAAEYRMMDKYGNTEFLWRTPATTQK